MNTIKMKSVRELVRATGKSSVEKNSPIERYKISSYQRGYRWKAEEQVRALLDDVKIFCQQQKDEIYCLQPIVVAKGNDDNGEFWEVIDGQQRLTTLFLLLHVLGKEVYNIDYEVRDKSAKLLTDIVEGKAVDTDKSPDAYFMSEAYRFIKDWVERQTQGNAEFDVDKLRDQVQVIWYEVALTSATPEEQEKEKIDIFNRLNIGKIPLDDAELLRALFLNHIVGAGTHDDILLKGIFATEWQEMEYFLQKDDVWGFLNPEDKSMRNRILLLFQLVAQAKTSQGRATFCYFENELRKLSREERTAKVQDYWKETKRLFAFIRACYNDRHLYHILGLCFALKLCKLNELVELSKIEKTKFRNVIETKIKGKFKNVKLEILNYNDDAADIKNVLLLFNVLTMDQQGSLSQQRFPFHIYHQKNWSLEHIHAQKSEAVQGNNNIPELIASTLKELNELYTTPNECPAEIEAIKQQLQEFSKQTDLDKSQTSRFYELLRHLDAYFSDDSSGEIHEMSNMALLTSGDNAALNNSYFLSKRIKLLQLERNGAFIPPCTRNVFLKVYSPIGAPSYKWGKADREAYLKAMKEMVKEYITDNETSNNDPS